MEKYLKPDFGPFAEKDARRMFIKKVYYILFVHILVTLGIIAVFLEPNVSEFCKSSQSTWPLWTSLGILIVLFIFLACIIPLRRRPPFNYIFLLIFTLFMGLFIGISSATFSSTIDLLMAVGSSAVIVIALNIIQLSTDNRFISIIISAIISYLIFVLVHLCVPDYKVWKLFLSGVGVFIYSGYIILDTQLMLAGHAHPYPRVTPEEYVFGALNLYIDIIFNIFNFCLMCFEGLELCCELFASC